MLYVANPQLEIVAHQAENPHTPVQQIDLPMDDLSKKGLKKKKEDKPNGMSVEPIIIPPPSGKKKDKKNRKLVRTAGGTTWEDPTLGEWEEGLWNYFCILVMCDTDYSTSSIHCIYCLQIMQNL